MPSFSKQLAGILIILYGGAFLLLIPLSFFVFFKISIHLLILISAFFTTRKHLFFIGHPLYGCVLRYRDDGKIQLRTGENGQILAMRYYHPKLVVFNVKLNDGKIHTLVIFSDALDDQTFHLLRVYLKFIPNKKAEK